MRRAETGDVGDGKRAGALAAVVFGAFAGLPGAGWAAAAAVAGVPAAAAAAAAPAGASVPAPADAGAPSAATRAARPGAGLLRPHVVTYRVTFKGMAGGDLTLALKPDPGSDGWIYETHANPSFLARLVVSGASTEKGWFDVAPDGSVRPRRYLVEDGTRESKRDVGLDYDWSAGRVKGYARGGALDLPLAPGTQDAMSIRALLIARLQAGREPGTVPMIDGREVKEFVYRREGVARIPTAFGELDTVVYTSARPGADARARTWKYWFAPSLGHLPVRIEQRAEGEARLVFAARSVDWR